MYFGIDSWLLKMAATLDDLFSRMLVPELVVDNNDKWNENNTQQHFLFHDQAMCSECCLSNLIIRMIGKHIVQPIIFSSIQMACLSIWNFYSSIRMAKQTVQIIYSPVWMVCPSIRNFLLIRSNGWPNRSNNSSVWTVRQTVQTLQGLLINHSSSMRFCHLNGFPLVSVLP